MFNKITIIMKSLVFVFISKELMSGLRSEDKELSEAFFEAVTTTKGLNAHYVKYPFKVAGWYIEDNKAGKAFIAEWSEPIEAANIETKEKPATTKVPKKANRGDLLQEYAKLSGQAKKSAADKKRIKAIESEIMK